jgi:beta-lactamase class D
MGNTKKMYMEEQEENLEQEKMKDADYRKEEWIAGPIEVTFTKQYHFLKTEMYEQQRPFEDIVDTIERIAWEKFQSDLASGEVCPNDDNFTINVKD